MKRERPTTAATRETAATRRCRDDEWIGKVFFAKFDPKVRDSASFLSFSELQLCENGVFVVSRLRHAVFMIVRASVRLASEPRQFRDCAPRRRSGTTTSSPCRACPCPGRRRACRGPASTSPARSSGWTSSSSRSTPWRLFRRYAYPFPTVTTDSIVVGLSRTWRAVDWSRRWRTLVPTHSHSRAFIATEARRWRTGAYRRRTPPHQYPTSTPSQHACTPRTEQLAMSMLTPTPS